MKVNLLIKTYLLKALFYFKTKIIYKGLWLNCKQNGKGTFSYTNGDIYCGDFEVGLFNGQGKMTNSNGEIYEGKFSDPIKPF